MTSIFKKQKRPRVIPTLLLRNESLVKTINFQKFNYVGDPLNTVRIFNDLEVDELLLLDISATPEKRGPNWKLLEMFASECFMPLAYGGGIKTFEDASRLFKIGYEKVIVNSAAFTSPELITTIAEVYGSQAVVASIDYRLRFFGRREVYSAGGTRREAVDLLEWSNELARRGAGEILLNSIDRDGTWEGYDLSVLSDVSKAISVPLVASGGAGTIEHLGSAIRAGAAAVAVGSMVIYQKKGMGVLIHFPDRARLKKEFNP